MLRFLEPLTAKVAYVSNETTDYEIRAEQSRTNRCTQAAIGTFVQTDRLSSPLGDLGRYLAQFISRRVLRSTRSLDVDFSSTP